MDPESLDTPEVPLLTPKEVPKVFAARGPLNPNLITDTPSTVTTVMVTVVVLLDTPPVSLTLKEAPKVSARGPLKNPKKRLLLQLNPIL